MNFIKFIITFFSIFALTLTLSADDFSIGLAYGLHKIHIPLKTMPLILLGSAISTWGVMLLGKLFTMFVPNYLASWVSAVMLALVGLKMLYGGIKKKENYDEYIEKNSLSKALKPWEPITVGFALGVDDFAQALGLSVAGFPIVLTVILLELSELIAILFGNFLALKGFSKRISGKLSVLPGIVLLFVALWQVIQ